jgi:hypothetical protein
MCYRPGGNRRKAAACATITKKKSFSPWQKEERGQVEADWLRLAFLSEAPDSGCGPSSPNKRNEKEIQEEAVTNNKNPPNKIKVNFFNF